jgi:DedD protein
MDQQLKARLIGAIILVALAVFLIPELLSGRKAESPETVAHDAERGTRTYTIDLTGVAQPAEPAQTKAQAAATKPPALPAPTTETSSAAPTDANSAMSGGVDGAPGGAKRPLASTQTATSDMDKAAPALKSAAAATTSVAPAPPSPPLTSPPKQVNAAVKGGWSVQVGAFGSSSTASKLVADLLGDGYKAYVSPISKGGKTLHRVRVGPEATRPDADRLAAKLKGKGLPAAVVAND